MKTTIIAIGIATVFAASAFAQGMPHVSPNAHATAWQSVGQDPDTNIFAQLVRAASTRIGN